MACRIGISSNLKDRKKYWKKQYPRLKNWKVLDQKLSYSWAQRKENLYSQNIILNLILVVLTIAKEIGQCTISNITIV